MKLWIDLPAELVGVLTQEAEFVCARCIRLRCLHPDACDVRLSEGPREKVCGQCLVEDALVRGQRDENDEPTTVLERDEWFEGQLCSRCERFVERGGA